MSFHDAYLRRTPFELAFAGAEGAFGLPSEVSREAEARGLDPTDRHAFLRLETVTSFVRGVRSSDEGGAALVEYGTLAYHATHFARAERRVLLLSTEAARALTAAGWSGPGPVVPAESGYVQVPRHLFWVRPGRGDTAEAVDGWFWTRSSEGTLHVLVIAGVREDRPGFAVVPVPEAPWSEAPAWVDAVVRPGGDDFAPTLPGGELGGLYSIEAAGEVLKLTARLFARVAAGAGTEERAASHDVHGPDPREGDAGRAGPPRSALPYTRVS